MTVCHLSADAGGCRRALNRQTNITHPLYTSRTKYKKNTCALYSSHTERRGRIVAESVIVRREAAQPNNSSLQPSVTRRSVSLASPFSYFSTSESTFCTQLPLPGSLEMSRYIAYYNNNFCLCGLLFLICPMNCSTQIKSSR